MLVCAWVWVYVSVYMLVCESGPLRSVCMCVGGCGCTYVYMYRHIYESGQTRSLCVSARMCERVGKQEVQVEVRGHLGLGYIWLSHHVGPGDRTQIIGLGGNPLTY